MLRNWNSHALLVGMWNSVVAMMRTVWKYLFLCRIQGIFFLTFFFFSFFKFYFTILYWFCHTSTWIRQGCTHVPNPEPPTHLPPHTISVGHPSAPAPSILYPASNLDWHGCNHHLQWFKSPKNKVWHCFHCFPIYFPWSDGTSCHDLCFLNVEL